MLKNESTKKLIAELLRRVDNVCISGITIEDYGDGTYGVFDMASETDYENDGSQKEFDYLDDAVAYFCEWAGVD